MVFCVDKVNFFPGSNNAVKSPQYGHQRDRLRRLHKRARCPYYECRTGINFYLVLGLSVPVKRGSNVVLVVLVIFACLAFSLSCFCC